MSAKNQTFDELFFCNDTSVPNSLDGRYFSKNTGIRLAKLNFW